jgi:hypothetical protein
MLRRLSMTHDDSGDVWLVSGHFRAVLDADLGERPTARIEEQAEACCYRGCDLTSMMSLTGRASSARPVFCCCPFVTSDPAHPP